MLQKTIGKIDNLVTNVDSTAGRVPDKLQRSIELKEKFPELSKKPVPQTFTSLSPEMENFLRDSLNRSPTIEGQDDITDYQQEMADRGPLSVAARGLQIIPAVSGQVPTFREAENVGAFGSEVIPQRFITPAEGDFPASLAAPPLVSAPPAAPAPRSRGLGPAPAPLKVGPIPDTNNLLSTMTKPAGNLIQQPAIDTESTVAGEMEGASNFIPLPDAKNTNMFDATKNFSVGLDQSQVNRNPIPPRS